MPAGAKRCSQTVEGLCQVSGALQTIERGAPSFLTSITAGCCRGVLIGSHDFLLVTRRPPSRSHGRCKYNLEERGSLRGGGATALRRVIAVAGGEAPGWAINRAFIVRDPCCTQRPSDSGDVPYLCVNEFATSRPAGPAFVVRLPPKSDSVALRGFRSRRGECLLAAQPEGHSADIQAVHPLCTPVRHRGMLLKKDAQARRSLRSPVREAEAHIPTSILTGEAGAASLCLEGRSWPTAYRSNGAS